MDVRSQRLKRRLPLSLSEGFTLIEVTLAILILAVGLSVIIGLQSSTVNQSIRERNKEVALLAGRRLLSQLEISEEDLEPVDLSAPLPELLAKYNADEKGGQSEGSRNSESSVGPNLSSFQGTLKIEPWGIPDVNPEALRRVTLTIAWGPNRIDSATILYFIPSPSQNPKD